MDEIYLNGKYTTKSNAQISVMDRGFLFGDGVYELIPVFNKKIFLLHKHLGRLKNSLNLIGRSMYYVCFLYDSLSCNFSHLSLSQYFAEHLGFQLKLKVS